VVVWRKRVNVWRDKEQEWLFYYDLLSHIEVYERESHAHSIALMLAKHRLLAVICVQCTYGRACSQRVEVGNVWLGRLLL
jgi:hypothetical protein